MIQRDFIMRMVQQFVAALLRVINLRTEGQVEEANKAIEQAYRSALGCGSEFIESLSSDEMLNMMRSGIFSPEQLLIAARLIEEQAAGEEESDSADRLAKSLHLYLGVFAGPGSIILAEHAERIDLLVERIAVEQLTQQTLLLGVSYYASVGSFDRAESMLFHAADQEPHSSEVVACGRAFYRDLEALPDDRLTGGGLPREEMMQGRLDFDALCSSG